MTKLYFPRRGPCLQTSAPAMAEAAYGKFFQAGQDLEERGDKMARDFLADPDSVSKQDVVDLIKDTYRLTVQLFEEKLARGERLLPEEREIYDLCRKEISTAQEDGPYQGILSALFHSIELIRNCITTVKNWFDLTSEKEKADLCIVSAGDEILPRYGSLIEGFFSVIKEFFIPLPVSVATDLAVGQEQCARYYQRTAAVDKPLASSMLDIADYAYRGHAESKPEEYQKLKADELPEKIRVLYDENKGLLTSSRGLRAWLGKKDNSIVVSYSGTDTKNFDMVYADVVQLSAPSVLYLKAAGLLKLMLDHMPGRKFFVTGHSLGGGLSQFSLTANVEKDRDRLNGYGYNPAGLSQTSLDHLEKKRLEKATEKVWIFMTCADIVSPLGGKIGCLTTLPKTDRNAHWMDDLKVCMKEYLKEPPPAPSGKIAITWRNHSDSDFIPYTKTLSFVDQHGTVYPVFNKNVSSSATDFITVKIPDKLFAKLNLEPIPSGCCLGVYNKFNGTAHTVMNRLLLLTEQEPVVTDCSIGNIHSSIIYGKYGLGIDKFVKLLQEAYADSGQTDPDTQTAHEKALALLHDPLEEDKKAWCQGIKLQFGLDMQNIFDEWPLSERSFDMFINNITSDRIDIYRAIATDTAPTRDMILNFLSRFRQSVLEHLETLLDEAVRWGVITAEDEERYIHEILAFSDRVLAGV